MELVNGDDVTCVCKGNTLADTLCNMNLHTHYFHLLLSA